LIWTIAHMSQQQLQHPIILNPHPGEEDGVMFYRVIQEANACSAKNRDHRFIAASAVNEIGAMGLLQFMPDTLNAAAPECIGKVPTQAEFLADLSVIAT
jgi:hypothetical protein